MALTIDRLVETVLLELGFRLCREDAIQDVAVPAAQNFVVLPATQAPPATADLAAAPSVDDAGPFGAIVSALPADVGSHSLLAVAGANALKPLNLVVVNDLATGDPIQSGTQIVYGLLQAENGIAQGDTFNNTDKQVQISFVRPNNALTALEAVPAGDIQGKTIRYSYVRRYRTKDLPEQCALADGGFVGVADTAQANPTISFVEVNANVGPDTLLETGTNIIGTMPDYTELTFDSGVLEFKHNGADLRPGPDNLTTFDLYPSTVPAEISNGAFYTNRKMKAGDIIKIIRHNGT